jgi:16S rRNA processing protein RimM
VLTARLRDRSVRTLTVSTARAHATRLLIRFDEVPDRTVAETLRGAQLLVDAAELPPSDDPDAFYDHELEGLTAVLADGTEVGTVREIARSPGGELLVIDVVGGNEALVPFVREIVPEVDVAGGRVVLDPPEGLLS